jgi:hypothetical protein
MESPTMEAETFAVKSSEKEPEPLIFTWGYPGGMGMGGGGGGSTFTITSIDQTGKGGVDGEVGEGMVTPTPEVGILSVPPDMGTGGGNEEAVTPSPEATPIPTEAEPPSLAATPASVTVEPLILGLQEDKAGQIIAKYPQPSDQEAKAEPTQMWRTLVSDKVKIGLAAIAALFGVLALVFYTKR